jgi:hypothetical protein
MTKHVRLSEFGQGTRVFQVRDGATIAEVLAQAGTTVADRRLSQNGRPAKSDDEIVRDQSSVMLMPKADHG